jgi:hypothetical protein
MEEQSIIEIKKGGKIEKNNKISLTIFLNCFCFCESFTAACK